LKTINPERARTTKTKREAESQSKYFIKD